MEKINSMQRTVRVLAYICRDKTGVRTAEIARKFSMSSPAIYSYLKALVTEGYIVKDEISGRFRATLRVMELASHVHGNNKLSEITYSLLVTLSERICSTVHLAILEGDMGICISKIENSMSIPSITRVGMRFDLYPTALGKAMLCQFSDVEFDAYINRVKLEPFTEKTIINSDELRKEIKRTRDRGYSLDFGEHRQGLHALGLPVFNHKNEMIAALSTTVDANLPEPKLDNVISAVKRTSLDISRMLGGIIRS